MELSLTKLPWYAQVGAFVALAVGACGAFYYYYEMPVQAPRWWSRQTQLVALQGRHRQGLEHREEAAGVPGAGRRSRRRGSRTCKAVLPEEKDAADLLRRMQTVAAQSNLTIKSFKPAPIVTKQLHAEWPITLELDGTYHNLAIFFDRVGKFTRIVNISGLDVKGKDRAGERTRRLPRPAWRRRSCCSTNRRRRRPSPARNRGAGGEGRLSMRMAVAFDRSRRARSPRRARDTPQAPAPAPAPAGPLAAPQAPPAGARRRSAPPPENYTYQPDGRRDPFLNLLGTGTEPRPAVAAAATGRAGLTVAEISVRGIMQSRGALVAMIQGPDNKTYIVHQGDKLVDGTIKTVTPQGLVIVQEVNDPLSLVKQREVRKLLRSLEDAKE